MKGIDPRFVILLISGLQALLGLGLAVLFAYYYRVYARAHLQLWARSFAAMALYLVFSGATLMIARDDLALRTAVSMASQIFAYLHVALLILGTLALQAHGEAPRHVRNGIIAGAVVIGVCATLAFAWDQQAVQSRAFARVSLRFLISSAAYLGTAMALFGGTPWRQKPAGQRLVMVSFALFGTLSLANFALSATPATAMSSVLQAAAHWFSMLDLAAVLCIGLGLVLWLHDDERHRADRAARQVEQLTYFDAPSGLPNRRYFAQRLQALLPESVRRRQPLAVLVTRPDRLYSLREALGEAALAQLQLRQVAQLRAAAMSAEPLLARLDEDRLVLLLDPIRDTQDAIDRARDLRRRLALPFSANGTDVFVTPSVGLALFPEDAQDVDGLLAAAVSAQSRAENQGGNRVEMFSAELGAIERAQLTLSGEIQRALAEHQLELHFQPVLDLHTERFGFAEALLRWRHPTRGLLLPAAFLDTLESASLMPDLDRWVLDASCTHIAQRRRGAWLPLSINVSAQGFQLPEFPDWVADAIGRHGVDPGMLELEITEAAALRNRDQGIETLRRLKTLGVALSLDDFGVGYSSMSQLKHLAVDKIKIDQSFTAGVSTDRKDAAIVAAMTGLGRSLGLAVVAEGIETDAQLAFYRTLHADFAQGYLIARPMEADALVARLGEPALARLPALSA